MSWKHEVCGVLLAVAVALLGVSNCRAQVADQGTLTLTVQDQTGAVIPGAELVLRDISTNTTRKAQSQNAGTYSFVGLNIGTYELSVSKPGFSSTIFNSVDVHASRVTDLVVVLQIGSVAQKVIVAGSQTPLLETTSNVIGSTIDLKQIEDLPIAGRDPTQLLALLPGVVPEGNNVFVFNNQQHQAEVNLVDGVVGNSSRFKAYGNAEPAAGARLQNVQEVTAQTSQLNSGQGAGQAAVQVAFSTRQGTNAFHGRLFVDMQNSSFNANSWYNDYFGVPKPVSHEDDFGGALGGPILKNKLFFFGSYEQDHVPGESTYSNSFITPSLQAGDYTYLGTDGTPHTVNLFSLAGAAGLQSTMDTSIASEVANINGALKLGTIGNVGGEDQYQAQNVQQINFNEPNATNNYFVTARVDYNALRNVKAHFALNYNKYSAPTTLSPTYPGPTFTWQQDGQFATNYTAALGVDWTISPTLINQFQGGFLYDFASDAPKGSAGKYYEKYPIVWWAAPWGLNYGSSGGTSGVFFYSTISNFYPEINFSDSFVWQHGGHTFTFGGSFYREQDHYWNPPLGYDNVVMGLGPGDPALNVFQQTNPAIPDANPNQIGEMQSFYALLTGDINNIAGAHPIDPKTHQYKKYGGLNLDELQKAWGLNFQDSWRVRPDLTVNYGLRWDFTGDDHDLNSIYYSPNVAGLWGPSGVNNAFHPGSFNGDADPSYIARGHAYSPWNKSPQPNIGFAWNPNISEGFLGKLMGGRSTVVRGGYSLRRYTPQYQDYWTFASNYGSFFYQNYQINASNSTGNGLFQAGTLHLADYTSGNLPAYPADWYVSPESYSAQISESSQGVFAPLEGMNPHIAQPYVESWNFGVQRKVGRGNAIEVRYVGNRSVHQWMVINPNEVNIFENGFLNEFKAAQNNLAINAVQQPDAAPSFQDMGYAGQQATPIFDQAFIDNPQGGYTFGGFISNLQLGQVGSMAQTMSGPFGPTGMYFCNLVSSSFTPCANLYGYSGSGGPYPTNFFQANPYQSGNAVGYLDADGYSNYNSLQIEFRQQAWHGMQFNANYTFARAMGMDTQYTMRNMALAYGPTSSDIRHSVNVYGTYDLPFGKGQAFLNNPNGWLDRAVGGWIIGNITTFKTGGPFQMSGGNQTFNNLFDGGIVLHGVTNKQLQHAIGSWKVPGAPSYVRDWINPKYLSPSGGPNPTYLTPNSDPGTIGTRYWLHGLNTWNESLALTKVVPIREHMRLSLQGEFINAFNNHYWTTGDAGLQDSTFGETFFPGSNPRSIELRGNFEF